MRTAVQNSLNEPVEITEEVELAAPKAGEVRVKMAASGVCHSDLSIQNGTLPFPMPVVLGHEGAGVVEEVGPGVTSLQVGDHVVISWVSQCGQCYPCLHGQPEICEQAFPSMASGGLLDGTPRFSRGGAPVFHMSAAGTFAEATVVPATSAVKIDPAMPLDKAALIGCGVLTGVGAALNTAKVKPGSHVAVIGCGGVGLNVIQGARIAGAAQIVAVDMLDSKLELARTFGATHTVNASGGDAVAQVRALTATTLYGDMRGVDYAFEVIGHGETFMQAVDMTRRGGEAILVGVPRMDVVVTLPISIHLFAFERTLKGCMYGGADVFRDVPMLVEMYQNGILMLDELVSRTIDLAEVNDAFDAIKTGEVARSLIVY